MPAAPSLFEQLNAALASGEAEDAIKGVKVSGERKGKGIITPREPSTTTRNDGCPLQRAFRAATGASFSRSSSRADYEVSLLYMLEWTKCSNKRGRVARSVAKKTLICIVSQWPSINQSMPLSLLFPPRRRSSSIFFCFFNAGPVLDIAIDARERAR